MDNLSPAIVVVELAIMSLSTTPTVPSSNAVVPLLAKTRKKEIVPFANASTSVTGYADTTPAEAAPNTVAGNANSANKVFPDRVVSALAGCVPLYKRKKPEAKTEFMEFACAFASVFERERFEAIYFPLFKLPVSTP